MEKLIKKSKIKRYIAKIRFSHVMCLCTGALIPIYSDVLFLNGFDSSTVSAIMDTVVAGSVIYAAWSVRNWFKDRVKNKGFEHAQLILMDIHLITKLLFELQSDYKYFALNYMNGTELTKVEKNELILEREEILVQCSKIRKKSVELLVSIYGLGSWDMKLHYENDYITYLSAIEDAREKIEDKIRNIDIDTNTSHIARNRSMNNFKKEFEELIKKCSIMNRTLNKRFASVFSYSPPIE
ncbi:hypothetical protein IF851_16325 [Citrobacter freundii]|uniref:hypothetical protein n=1 Tax=Citrobacter freundii TaxID=546 RepID=UPI001748BFA2|nr:hypothetical protein [Citrobacter freundii]MBD5718040.1 hypothetical protein [Citrobacter freundii]